MLSGHIDEVCHHVARALRAEREKRGLSMTAVAERAGLSRTMIRFVESEVRNPTLETLLRIAYALELDLGPVIDQANAAAKKAPKRKAAKALGK